MSLRPSLARGGCDLMRTATLLLATALIGLALVGIPFEGSPIGTAQASTCTWDGDTDEVQPYATCEGQDLLDCLRGLGPCRF